MWHDATMTTARRRPRRPTRTTLAPPAPAAPPWTFLTNHAHVLLCLAKDPGARMRDVATVVGVTERAVQRIVRELEEAGYLRREKEGRRNRYALRETMPLRHPMERHAQVSALLKIVTELDE